MDSHLQSAAAFVEGGIQDACDDSCSICLEAFSESDPSSVTNCKHEFHLHCIFEWCQRSSQCPMCWQVIGLKDSTSQELLEAIESERSFWANQSHNTRVFHYPSFGDFELQLPDGASDVELDEHIIQHLAAAAAMGRARHGSRRGMRGRSASQGNPQFVVFSRPPDAPFIASFSASSGDIGETRPVSTTITSGLSVPLANSEEQDQHQASLVLPSAADPIVALQSGNSVASANNRSCSNLYLTSSGGQSSSINQERTQPSDIKSFSLSLKSCLNAFSTRYKESISKSTRGWKERLCSRSSSMTDTGSEVRREGSAGIATLSGMVECLEMRDESSAATFGASTPGISRHLITETDNERVTEGNANALPKDTSTSTSCAASSSSS